MKRISKFVGLMAVVMAMSAIVASGASAKTLNATFSGSVFGIPITTCDAVMTYTNGDPPTSLTLQASTFAGDPAGPNDPCDPSTLTLNNNPNVSFTLSGGTYTALINQINVTDVATGCTFNATNVSLAGTSNPLGPYSGSRSASGCGLPATITVSNAVFTP